MGAVVLAVTGAEALYADMGHFGVKPIQQAWLFLVFPALLLNYLGQGTLLLNDAAAISNPFYLLAPHWAQWPMVILATLATIIASQAVITGAYSVTHQAIQLGYLPRMRVLHTSAREYGQVYVPYINWLLLVAVLGVVLAFQTSGAMAAAYGVAVTGTMVLTNILAFTYFYHSRRWPLELALPVFGLFFVIDATFLAANMLKLMDGGWFPLGTGLVIYLIMQSWMKGKAHLTECRNQQSWSLHDFINTLGNKPLHRVDGVAVYMTSSRDNVPSALMNNIAHNKVIHSRNVFLTVEVDDTPFVDNTTRFETAQLADGFEQLHIRCGFMEEVDLKRILNTPNVPQKIRELLHATFFSSRDALRPAEMIFKSGGMRRKPISLPDRLQRMLFISMSTWALNSSDYYGVPSAQVVEMGGQLEL